MQNNTVVKDTVVKDTVTTPAVPFAGQVIMVADRGWVFVGDEKPGTTPNTVRLENAAVIRVWGTTRGLGELCLTGATPNTILDPIGVIEFERHAVLFRSPVTVPGGLKF